MRHGRPVNALDDGEVMTVTPHEMTLIVATTESCLAANGDQPSDQTCALCKCAGLQCCRICGQSVVVELNIDANDMADLTLFAR